MSEIMSFREYLDRLEEKEPGTKAAIDAEIAQFREQMMKELTNKLLYDLPNVSLSSRLDWVGS